MTKAKLTKLQQFEQKQLKKNPNLKSGDTVRVHAKIKEGTKERVQVFEGVVLRLAKGGIRSTVTVRKVSFGVGVERIFPLHSPTVEKIEKLSEGKIRQGRLYYLRKLKGRSARIEKLREQQGERIVEEMGTVATGPEITSSSSDDEAEKKSTILGAAESQKKN